MGKGAQAGMPLQLAGTRQILEFMDWGDYGALCQDWFCRYRTEPKIMCSL